jgi:hypothetical protein
VVPLAFAKRLAAIALVALATGACSAAAPTATSPIVPGGSSAPREVNVITKDYSFLPGVRGGFHSISHHGDEPAKRRRRDFAPHRTGPFQSEFNHRRYVGQIHR